MSGITQGQILSRYFVERGRAAARYEDSGVDMPGRCCARCERRTQSYPDACGDGWPCGDPSWVDRGSRCINWDGGAGRCTEEEP